LTAPPAGDVRRQEAWERRFPGTSAWISGQLGSGKFVGVQIFVSEAGQTRADVGVGMARSGSAMTAATLNYWFCATKPLMAIATAQLVEKGLVGLDDRVSQYIPEFGAAGKQAITVRHLLTHTAGLRHLTSPRPFFASDQEITKAVCESAIRDDWPPGQRAAYTPFAAWYVLGELVGRLAQDSLPRYVARHIFEPLGLTRCWLGMPADAVARERAQLSVPHAVVPGRAPVPLRFLCSPATLRLVNAASGAVGPIGALGKIFQALLHPAGDGRLLSPHTVREFVAPQRTGLLDETYQFDWDWGLGFAVDMARLCPAAGADGFGHPGGSTLVLADRAADRVIAVAVNGVSAWDGAPQTGENSAPAELVRNIYRDMGGRDSDGG